MVVFLLILTIYLNIQHFRIFKFSPIFFILFTIFQITLCKNIRCTGTSVIWNVYSGYLINKLIFFSYNTLDIDNVDTSILTSLIVTVCLLIFSNLFFMMSSWETNVAHVSAFTLGFFVWYMI